MSVDSLRLNSSSRIIRAQNSASQSTKPSASQPLIDAPASDPERTSAVLIKFLHKPTDDQKAQEISARLRGQTRGLNDATSTPDSVTYEQPSEPRFIKQRMRELAVQAANDTLSLSDREIFNKEVAALETEIERINQQRSRLLEEGSNSSSEGLPDSTRTMLTQGTPEAERGGEPSSEVSTPAPAQSDGSAQSSATPEAPAADARVKDVDMAREMMNFTKNNILSQAALAMLANDNEIPQGVLQLLR